MNMENKRRSVGFTCVDIIEFEPTIFTSTVTSGGLPVGMSSTERKRIRRRLDSFEQERETKSRICRDKYMDEGFLLPEEREEILGAAGHQDNFDTVTEEVNRIIEYRRISNELDRKYIFNSVDCTDLQEEYEQLVDQDYEPLVESDYEHIVDDEDYHQLVDTEINNDPISFEKSQKEDDNDGKTISTSKSHKRKFDTTEDEETPSQRINSHQVAIAL